MTMCTPSAIEHWKCLLPEISRQDPTPLPLQRFYLALTTAAYLPVLFPISFGIHFIGLDESYLTFDETHLPPTDPNASLVHQFVSKFVTLLQFSTGLSTRSLVVCTGVTCAFYAWLLWLDFTTSHRPYPWPKAWKTDNNICYDEMFAEPPRRNRVIRRPGNTLSNFFYLLLSLVVLKSTILGGDSVVLNGDFPKLPGFVVSDAMFGVMLFILSLASTAWHGCNALWSHVVDLWSMEAVIVYFPIRIMSSGILSMLLKRSLDFEYASRISSLVCIGTFTSHIILNGKRFYYEHKQGFWRDMCPISVRNRLPDSPRLFQKQHDKKYQNNYYLKPISLLEVYVFILMPVFQNIPSWICSKAVFHSIGSTFLVRVVNTTLAFAWVYRIFERWALDGCKPLQFCEKKIILAKKNGNITSASVWTVIAAILSPTAALHFWTGITLIAGYCHSRSMEIVALSMSSGLQEASDSYVPV